MNLILAAISGFGLLSIPSAIAVNQQADIFYNEKSYLGPSMWHFNKDGLSIYSPNGDLIKQHRKKSLCKPYTDYRGNLKEDCSYFTMASDGHRYVWAVGHHNGEHHIAAFDIDTGDHAGDHSTCNTPLDLEYLPSRREMWVRCASSSASSSYGGDIGEIDVFSSGVLTSDHKLIHLNGTSRPYGRIAVNSAMGPYGYASAYDMGHISELDLSSKTVSGRYTIPKASGSYAMGFSPVNEHLFVRTRVCCSCGNPTSDAPSCGYGDPKQVIVQTGPSAGPNPQNGTCSTPCLGSPADTLGVVEFDTVGKIFVANHNIKDGSGFGADPAASPDGKYILLMPNDGGKNVRIIEAGSNGEASKVLKDVEVNFQGGAPGKMVVSDFAFVTNNGRNILVLAANSDNEIVLVDINDNFKMKRLNLSPGVSESTGGDSRQVEWAIGSNFVWVNGGESKEQYIIEIPDGVDSATISRSLADVPSGQMIFVNNYERLRTVEMMPAKSSDTLAVAGVSIGSIGLAIGLFASYIAFQKASSSSSVTAKSGGGPEQFMEDPEARTLGSKVVN